MTEWRQRLLRSIEQAFAGVQLGEGVSLHETVVIDHYGGQQERRAARAPDEKHDWRKLIGDPGLAEITGVGGLSFYDAAGLHFHLPAYLSLAVTDFESVEASHVLGSLMFQLTAGCEYSLERFSVLDTAQRQCVREVLVFLRDEYELVDAELDQAIEGYWSSDSEATRHDATR
jgi:hypothetical protein